MTTVQAFWHFLYALQHATSPAEAVDANGAVKYGGEALQAFVDALVNGWRFIWIDVAS